MMKSGMISTGTAYRLIRSRATALLVAFAVMISMCAGAAFESYGMAAAGLRGRIRGTWAEDGDELYNLREVAKCRPDGFDIMQGACSDGKKYAYFAFSRRRDDKVRIVKMKIAFRSSDPAKTRFRYVRTSKTLKGVRHGNDMAYVKDPLGKGKDVIIINSSTEDGIHRCYLGSIDPATLSEIGGTVCKYWSDLSKCSTKVYPSDTKVKKKKRKTLEEMVDDHHGYSAIAYSAEKGLFVATVKTDRDLLILKPVWNSDRTIRKLTLMRYIRQNKINAMAQGIDCDGDYIYTAWSPDYRKLSTNMLQVYNWSGRHIGNRDVTSSFEIENVFHTGKGSKAKFYSTFYCAHTVKKTVKKKVRVKWKKVWKTVNGVRKKVWKYKKKKRKITTYELMRDSYCMYLGNIRK